MKKVSGEFTKLDLNRRLESFKISNLVRPLHRALDKDKKTVKRRYLLSQAIHR